MVHTGSVLLRVLIAIGVVSVALTAEAQPRPAEVIVSWSAPPECRDAAAVYPLIEDHLGRGLEARDALAVRVEIAAVAAGYRARLRFGDGTPERALDGASCESVVDAAALIMAMALREAMPRPPPAGAPPAPRLEVASAVAVDGPRRWGLTLRADAVGGVGVMPGAGVAAGASVGVLLGEWRIGVEGRLWREGDATLVPGAGARIDLWTAGMLGCRALGAAGLVGCAGLEAGEMGAVAYGFEGAGRGRELWLAALGRLEVAVPLGAGFSFVAAGDLVAPASAPQFVLDDSTEIYAARAAAARVQLGLEARIY